MDNLSTNKFELWIIVKVIPLLSTAYPHGHTVSPQCYCHIHKLSTYSKRTLEAGWRGFPEESKKEICRLIHISTAPTTTVISLSRERFLVVVIRAVDMWITLLSWRNLCRLAPDILLVRLFVVRYSTIGIVFTTLCPFLMTNATFYAITRYIDVR